MTRPDSEALQAKVLLATAAIAGATSFGLIRVMQFWKAPVDYWLAWSSGLLGFGAVGALAAGVICTLIAIDSARSN